MKERRKRGITPSFIDGKLWQPHVTPQGRPRIFQQKSQLAARTQTTDHEQMQKEAATNTRDMLPKARDGRHSTRHVTTDGPMTRGSTIAKGLIVSCHH